MAKRRLFYHIKIKKRRQRILSVLCLRFLWFQRFALYLGKMSFKTDTAPIFVLQTPLKMYLRYFEAASCARSRYFLRSTPISEP